ncbi:MAG: hypothetical protein H0V18_07060 [Pyrinomonadaceae bacterium]|nr:hypothetical protein [Pyrinomonadaceae bacterium]
MELLLNVGIGSIRFAMTPVEVHALISEEPTYEDWMGGNRNDSLLFHGLIFGFDGCDSTGPLENSRLTEVSIHGREDVVLWGRNICYWTKDAVKDHLDRNGLPYQIVANGDVSVDSSLAISFDNAGRLEYIEMWDAARR